MITRMTQTARAIGKQQAYRRARSTITGAEWDKLSASEREEAALDNQVFARTTPQTSLKLLKRSKTAKRSPRWLGMELTMHPP